MRRCCCAVLLCAVLCDKRSRAYTHTINTLPLPCLCRSIQRHSIQDPFRFFGGVMESAVVMRCQYSLLRCLLHSKSWIMSFEWKFLSLQSISGVREWVCKAHCRPRTHISIPIGLTYICFRLLFIIIIVCLHIAYTSIWSSNQMESKFTSHMMRVTFHGNQVTWTMNTNREQWTHTVCLYLESSERRKKKQYLSLFTEQRSLTGKFLWRALNNLWPTIKFWKVTWTYKKFSRHTHGTHTPSQVTLHIWTTCVSPTIS